MLHFCSLVLGSFHILESQWSDSKTAAFRRAPLGWPAQRLEVLCSLLNSFFFPLTLKSVNIIHCNDVGATQKLILDGDQGNAFAKGKTVLQLKIVRH